MTGRVCEWCGELLPANARPEKRACNDRCRAKAWKWRRGYGNPEPPPEGSPLRRCDGCGGDVVSGVHRNDCRVLQQQRHRAAGPAVRTAPARRKRSGLQLSYRRAVDAVAEHLAGPPLHVPRDSALAIAEHALRDALPDRQRELLEGRDG